MDKDKFELIKQKLKHLHDATFYGYSSSRKSIGIRHNAAHPYGVRWTVSYFNTDLLLGERVN